MGVSFDGKGGWPVSTTVLCFAGKGGLKSRIEAEREATSTDRGPRGRGEEAGEAGTKAACTVAHIKESS